jgi:hypothetical protein
MTRPQIGSAEWWIEEGWLDRTSKLDADPPINEARAMPVGTYPDPGTVFPDQEWG